MERTKEKLAKALEEADAPSWMAFRAREGHYDDFESNLPMPINELINNCMHYGLKNLAARAMNGEFDSTKEEADDWFQREGKNLI